LGRVKAQLKEQQATIAVGQPSSDMLSSNYNISKTSLSEYFVGPIYFGLSILFLANFCLITVLVLTRLVFDLIGFFH